MKTNQRREKQEPQGLAAYLLEQWQHRDEVLANEALSNVTLEAITPASAQCGSMRFTIGQLLRCWQSRPEFQQLLPDGSIAYIYRWAGSILSGVCHVHYINLDTGELGDAPYHPAHGTDRSFQALTRAARV